MNGRVFPTGAESRFYISDHFRSITVVLLNIFCFFSNLGRGRNYSVLYLCGYIQRRELIAYRRRRNNQP